MTLVQSGQARLQPEWQALPPTNSGCHKSVQHGGVMALPGDLPSSLLCFTP